MSDPIVVVGAGQAAASLISRHVALGNQQSILLIGEEPHPPYQRPPLSKKFLLGELERERLFIRPLQWYRDQGIDTRFDTRITAIDRERRRVETATGESIRYDKLVLCTGSSARVLPDAIGGALAGVFTLRSIADIDRMAPAFQSGRKLLVVGGGYIGLEAAAVARKLGLEVAVVEMAERILQRVASVDTSDYFRRLHTGHGVILHESTPMKRLLESNGKVCGAELASGDIINADLVLVGIGGSPNIDLAETAGLDCDNGISVSDSCQTSDPNIYAAGDCASFIRNGQRIRLESVQNASNQGDLIARVLAGEALTYTSLPWFWSDQYDCKLQIAGLNFGHNRTVVRASSDPKSLSVWYYAGEKLLAIDAMNDPSAYAFGRRMIADGKNPSPEKIADPATDLKALAKGT